jgi:uridine kinase
VLHAINPRISSLLPKERLLKIFISVSTNINNNGERILSGRKIRFVRRMVRDSIYRNADAKRTLSMWKNVLRGEDLYLYPHRDNADVSFDTFHEFELGIMRPFVLNLISEELARENSYAKTVRDALLSVHPIDLSLLPESSLIREFVPGGMYENLY